LISWIKSFDQALASYFTRIERHRARLAIIDLECTLWARLRRTLRNHTNNRFRLLFFDLTRTERIQVALP
jgi:hypothetical protein